MAARSPRKGKGPKKDDSAAKKVAGFVGRQVKDAVIAGTKDFLTVAGGKGAHVAGRAAVRTGIPARVRNKLTGQEVFLHGSATKNLQMIAPRVAPARPQAGAKIYGKRPGNQKQFDYAISDADFYAATRFREANPAATRYEGAIYIAKAKGGQRSVNAYYTTSNPAKVVNEIPVSGNLPYRYFQTSAETKKKVLQAYKRAGGRLNKK